MSKSTKGRKFPPVPFTDEQACALLEACGGGWRGARNRALLVMYYRAGFRCAEALALDIGDLQRVPGGLIATCRTPKGWRRGKGPRTVGLDPKAQALVEAWLELREERWGDSGPLFVSRTGKRLLPSYVRQLLPYLARKAGIGRRAHAHAFRHTFAKEMYEEHVGMVELMQALGHSRLDTTQKYLGHIGATEVVAVTTGRTW